MRVAGSCALKSYSGIHDARLSAWKTEYPPGTIIHVDDESPIMSLHFLARLSIERLTDLENVDEQALLRSITIFPANDQHLASSFEGDGLDSITLTVRFGAENAGARSETFTFSRRELARRILAGSADTIRQMLAEEIEAWPEDLFPQAGASDD